MVLSFIKKKQKNNYIATHKKWMVGKRLSHALLAVWQAAELTLPHIWGENKLLLSDVSWSRRPKGPRRVERVAIRKMQ